MPNTLKGGYSPALKKELLGILKDVELPRPWEEDRESMELPSLSPWDHAAGSAGLSFVERYDRLKRKPSPSVSNALLQPKYPGLGQKKQPPPVARKSRLPLSRDTFREFAVAARHAGLLRLLTPYYDRIMPSMGKIDARLRQGIPIQSPELENERSLMVRYPRPKGKKRPRW